MKLELNVLRILFVILAVAMIATGFHFLNSVPTAADKVDAIVCTVLSLGGGVAGVIAALVNGLFKPVKTGK